MADEEMNEDRGVEFAEARAIYRAEYTLAMLGSLLGSFIASAKSGNPIRTLAAAGRLSFFGHALQEEFGVIIEEADGINENEKRVLEQQYALVAKMLNANAVKCNAIAEDAPVPLNSLSALAASFSEG